MGGSPLGAESGYLERIGDAYRREVYRQALFATLARREHSAERRDKWLALACLEEETCERIVSILQSHGSSTARDPRSVEAGQRDGELAARQRWIDCIDALLTRVAAQISSSEALERRAPANDRGVWQRVTAHQVALQSFLRLELSGRAAESIGPAHALLERRRDACGALAAAG